MCWLPLDKLGRCLLLRVYDHDIFHDRMWLVDQSSGARARRSIRICSSVYHLQFLLLDWSLYFKKFISVLQDQKCVDHHSCPVWSVHILYAQRSYSFLQKHLHPVQFDGFRGPHGRRPIRQCLLPDQRQCLTPQD